MKLLLFGDTHGDTDFTNLEELAEGADLILHCGDLTDFSAQLDAVLDALDAFAQHVKKPVIFVHGNHEGPDVEEAAAARAHLVYLHDDTYETEDLVVYGYGGGGFAKEDVVLEQAMARFQESAPDKAQVWLFHGPPHDMTIDVIEDWGPTGCRTKARLIVEHGPRLVVAGHIHEGWATKHQVGQTIVVNPGPAGMLIEL